MHWKAGTLGVAALAAMAGLAGCGGDDAPAGGGGAGGGGGGTLTISAATPATENTTVDTSKATTVGNDARAADAFSATPYCEVFAENAPGANGRIYALQVYFRQSDQAALHVAVMSSAAAGQPPSGYTVFNNNAGNPITDVAVDTAARTVTFNNKVLAGNAGEAGTLAGVFAFPANSAKVVGCGA